MLPDIPKPKLNKRNDVKLFACDKKNIGTAQKSIMAPITHLPPYLSVSIPTGKRKIEPTNTGTPNNQPIWTGVHLNISLLTRKVTNTPFVIHAAKQTVNASVLKNRILCDLPVATVSIYILLFLINKKLYAQRGWKE